MIQFRAQTLFTQSLAVALGNCERPAPRKQPQSATSEFFGTFLIHPSPRRHTVRRTLSPFNA
jgi:hypothetical protein